MSNLIHVPGLRGVPARGYPVSGIGDTFPNRFDDYTASVIKRWQDDGDARVGAVGAALEALDLTWKVSAEYIDAEERRWQCERFSQHRRCRLRRFPGHASCRRPIRGAAWTSGLH